MIESNRFFEFKKEPLLLEQKYNYLDDSNQNEQAQTFDESVIEAAKIIKTSKINLLEIASKHLKDYIKNSAIGIRVSQETLEKILLDGHIKNQFETGTSEHGKYDVEGRKNIENNIIGVPFEISENERPVYGMLFDFNNCKNPDDTFRLIDAGPGNFFGNCIIVLNKDLISPYCTFTIGDSYSDSENVKASLINHPEILGSNPELLIKLYENSINDNEESRFNLNYIEVQVHGYENHTLNAIQNIIFTEMPKDNVIDLLYNLKIPYTVIQPSFEVYSRRYSKYKYDYSEYFRDNGDNKFLKYIKFLFGKITFINTSGISKLVNSDEKGKAKIKTLTQ